MIFKIDYKIKWILKYFELLTPKILKILMQTGQSLNNEIDFACSKSYTIYWEKYKLNLTFKNLVNYKLDYKNRYKRSKVVVIISKQ